MQCWTGVDRKWWAKATLTSSENIWSKETGILLLALLSSSCWWVLRTIVHSVCVFVLLVMCSLLVCTLCTVCAKSYTIGYVSVHVYMCVCVTKYQQLTVLSVKNVQKGTHAAFLHLHIMNVTVNCWFTPDQALLLFLCSYMYLYAVPPLGCGGPMVRCYRQTCHVVQLFSHALKSWMQYCKPFENFIEVCPKELVHAPTTNWHHWKCIKANCNVTVVHWCYSTELSVHAAQSTDTDSAKGMCSSFFFFLCSLYSTHE